MLAKGEQNELYRVVGQKIKAIRTSSGISQETLASRLGFISRISIANIETGKQKVQLHTLVEIADILKVPLDVIVPTTDNIKQDLDPKLAKSLMKNKELNSDESKNSVKQFIKFSTSTK